MDLNQPLKNFPKLSKLEDAVNKLVPNVSQTGLWRPAAWAIFFKQNIAYFARF